MRTRGLTPAFVVLLALASGCAVHFVSKYDPVFDQGVTDLQANTETFLRRMADKAGQPAGVYASNTTFYEDAQGRIAALRARAEATPKAGLFMQHMDLLAGSYEGLRQLHQSTGSAGLTPALLQPAASALQGHFRDVLTLCAATREGR